MINRSFDCEMFYEAYKQIVCPGSTVLRPMSYLERRINEMIDDVPDARRWYQALQSYAMDQRKRVKTIDGFLSNFANHDLRF